MLVFEQCVTRTSYLSFSLRHSQYLAFIVFKLHFRILVTSAQIHDFLLLLAALCPGVCFVPLGASVFVFSVLFVLGAFFFVLGASDF